ncbi:hypothetical protein L798_04955 [Zootermopsis nevadensis]|uniref:CCDC66 domain-containing protein n=1 Tax=Zootermopsis nevadensis TaxID=136037 RepID=A0A067RLI8_ZOONE|nr:hypothetical protein L798_04955 [Zootermopsis nevadensis]
MVIGMDSDIDNDLVTLLLQSKSKIWEDKKRLGLLREKHNSEELLGTSQQSPVHVKYGSKEQCNLCDHVEQREEELQISCIPGFGQQKEHKKHSQSAATLPNDLQNFQKDEFISKLTIKKGRTGLGEKQSSETAAMVRFGEYSPQNPGLLSPGKTLLGLGEYEEKRRKILERKKREYLEQMAQARHSVKDAVSGRFSDLSQQQAASKSRFRSYMNMRSAAGTQTDLQITSYIQDNEYSSLAVRHGSVSPVVAATQTPDGEISVLPSLSAHPQIISIATQTPGGNVKSPKLEIVPTSDTSAVKGVIALPQHASYLPLNPRERKMVEFRQSYSPSFVQGCSPCPAGFDMTLNQSPDLRQRREAYQEELRRQIEEKRYIEAEEQKRAQEAEEAIARRAELQRERMRQEYIEEEAHRREKHLQRLRQAEEFHCRQEALNLEAELEHEVEARQKLEKRFENLEAGLGRASYSTQSLGVSLPVPALRKKYASEIAPSGHRNLSVNQDVPEDDVKGSSTRNSDTASRLQCNDTNNIAEQAQRQYLLHDRNADCTQLSERNTPQINNMEYPLHSSDTEYPLNNYSAGKKTNEGIIVSYHRPPTEIIKAAGYGNSVQNYCNGDDDTDALELSESRTKCFELPTEGIQHVSSLQPQCANNCKNKLDDSLPIPILRAPSPVIPAVRTGHATYGSDAMRKVETKWQVPAVERNVVRAKSDSNNILTQLGAVRHQLQLEQIRMEQHLQQQLKNKS